MKEDYVSFEVAKLLKEKGFIGECERRYSLIDTRDWQGDIRVELSTGESYSSQIIYIKESIQCPTLQMAMKWLREMKGIYITIEHGSYPSIRKHYFIPTIDSGEAYDINDEEIIQEFDTYEEAVEAAIKYCLTNLIK